MLKTSELFLDLSATLAGPLLEQCEYPWEALGQIKSLILEIGPTLDPAEYESPSENVWIHRTAKIYPNNYIAGPAIIGPETEVRPGAFIRGSALVGAKCVVGNSTELKNCILFDHVQVPHYNYIGDAVLGSYAHMGAGAICSNIKADKTNVVVHSPDGDHPTGLRKFGAILGDHADVGCNSVLCPGAVLLPWCTVYPLSRVRGVVPAHSIFKAQDNIVLRRE